MKGFRKPFYIKVNYIYFIINKYLSKFLYPRDTIKLTIVAAGLFHQWGYYMNQQLKILQEQISRQKKLRELQKSLDMQKTELMEREKELRLIRDQEQRDVDRLEGHSLTAFFAEVTGKKGERLDKERREAYEAAVKYDTVMCELSTVRQDLESINYELGSLAGCEDRYKEAMEQEQEQLRNSDPVKGPKIYELEMRVVNIQCQKREIQEAISAGEQAKIKADVVLDEMDKAKGWSTWDLLGGGIIADVQKHSHLDQAQGQIERLQVQLRRFQTELSDVQVTMENTQINVDGFLRFADWFFDDIFSGWTVHSKIKNSQSQVQEVRRKVIRALQNLKEMLRVAEENEKQVRAQLKAIVTEE